MSGYTMFIPGHMPMSVNVPGIGPGFAWDIVFKPTPGQLRKRAMELAKADYDNQEVVPFRAKTSLAEYENYYHELLGVSVK